MTFWVVAVAVVVVLGVIAWWSSGRSKRLAPGSNSQGDVARAEVEMQVFQHRGHNNGPYPGM
jgi:hypothetical protein